jgi:hypothetical protein
MKHLLQIPILIFIFSSIILPQIPNAGFENWTGGEPDGWTSNNIPSLLTTVTQSNQAHTLSSAVKLSATEFFCSNL